MKNVTPEVSIHYILQRDERMIECILLGFYFLDTYTAICSLVAYFEVLHNLSPVIPYTIDCRQNREPVCYIITQITTVPVTKKFVYRRLKLDI